MAGLPPDLLNSGEISQPGDAVFGVIDPSVEDPNPTPLAVDPLELSDILSSSSSGFSLDEILIDADADPAQQLESARSEVESLRMALRNASDRALELGEEKDVMVMDLQRQESERATLLKEAEEAKEVSEAQASELANLRAEVGTLREKNQAMKDAFKELSAELEELIQTNRSLMQQVDST